MHGCETQYIRNRIQIAITESLLNKNILYHITHSGFKILPADVCAYTILS